MTRQEIDLGQESHSAKGRRLTQKFVFMISMVIFFVIAFNFEANEPVKDVVIYSWNVTSHSVVSCWNSLNSVLSH